MNTTQSPVRINPSSSNSLHIKSVDLLSAGPLVVISSVVESWTVLHWELAFGQLDNPEL